MRSLNTTGRKERFSLTRLVDQGEEKTVWNPGNGDKVKRWFKVDFVHKSEHTERQDESGKERL